MSRVFNGMITELSRCEVFVFGSNLEGQHTGGAARTAYEKFGAEWGVGAGPTGQCYAIPTMHGGIDEIKPYVDEFIEYAKTHPNNRFLVTRIGCGIAGFTDEEMAPLFKEAKDLVNVCFNIDWMLILTYEEQFDMYFLGIVPKEEVIPIPKAITEQDLQRLCKQYKYMIGARFIKPFPDIEIRYVAPNNEFAYVKFGDFYMDEYGELYVWTRDKKLAEYHNQDMVDHIFEDECKDRIQSGYSLIMAIFAGVRTPFKAASGRYIYTGDVLRVWLKGSDGSCPTKYDKEGYEGVWAFGTLGENTETWEAEYACVLDNHCATPDMCARMERCGTVFYRLDWNEYPITIRERCSNFQDIRLTSGLSKEDKLVLAKFTPSTDQELWKYHALELISTSPFDEENQQ